MSKPPQDAIDVVHERPNAGCYQLQAGTRCCLCGQPLCEAPRYLVRIVRTARMKAPAFYYAHLACPVPDLS